MVVCLAILLVVYFFLAGKESPERKDRYQKPKKNSHSKK